MGGRHFLSPSHGPLWSHSDPLSLSRTKTNHHTLIGPLLCAAAGSPRRAAGHNERLILNLTRGQQMLLHIKVHVFQLHQPASGSQSVFQFGPICSHRAGGGGAVPQPASRGPSAETSCSCLELFVIMYHLYHSSASYWPLDVHRSARPVPYVGCCQASLCLLVSLIGGGNAPGASHPLLSPCIFQSTLSH